MRSFIIILVAFCAISCSQLEYETIVIRGSDTEVNLVLHLAEDFMKEDSAVSIAVTGGGSGTGIASLLNGKTEIANSSRPFKEEENILATDRNLDVRPIVFALDALTFITHPDLPIKQLTMDELRAIFVGDIVNWKELDGPNLDITLYGRQGNSGTYTYIQSEILKQDYSPAMRQMNGSAQIVESIKRDKSGIGYVGIAYIADSDGNLNQDVQPIKLRKPEDSVYYSPLSALDILQEKYPVVRPLYQYINGSPSQKLKDFLLFELSPQGQDIIRSDGYFPVPDKYRSQNEKALGE